MGDHRKLELQFDDLAFPPEWKLRPSVASSDFFRDYCLKSILIDPERAWVDLRHTRGIGIKSATRIAFLVGVSFAKRWPREWQMAVSTYTCRCKSEIGLPEWPVSALQMFIMTWCPNLGEIEQFMAAEAALRLRAGEGHLKNTEQA